MYIETHKKKDGSFVTDEARDIAEQIEVLMTQNEKDESGPSTNDTIGKVFGEEHSDRVRCMGMGATHTNTFRNANHPSQLANSSTSKIPVELISIFDHGAQANDIENKTITLTTGRTSSDGSNENREDID
ncbi:hypothetical protein HN51_050759 [Arachis hypogaea]